MGKILPLFGVIAASFSISWTGVAMAKVAPEPSVESALVPPSQAIKDILQARIRSVKDMKVAFGEQFPDKFQQGGAFSKFSRPSDRFRPIGGLNYNRYIQNRLQPNRLNQLRALPRYQKRSELDLPTVASVFDKHSTIDVD